MRFDHKAMADQFVLLNMGLCNFYVKSAEECNGKWGAYIKVGLKLQEVAPPQNTAETSVLLSASNTALWKLKQFLEAIGRGKDFESDNLDASTLVKAQGQCMVGHKEFVSNKDGKILVGLDVAHFDKDGAVPELITLSDAAPKNAVAQTTGTTQTQQQKPAQQEFDDDVPF